jgi:hypothetical protein
MCAAVRFEDSKQKARDGFLCAGFCNFRDDGAMRDLPDMPPWMAHLRGAFVKPAGRVRQRALTRSFGGWHTLL